MDEMGFVRETLGRIESKVDALGTQLATLDIGHATLATRVTQLEKASDHRWGLVSTWIASGLAIALSLLPYLK